MTYTIYCDGASRKDGRGGWGASIRRRGMADVDLYGGEFDTTNNRMELMAAIEALWFIPRGSTVTLVCDSMYVVAGASEHMEMWLRTNWRTSANKAVKNVDLWKELKSVMDCHRSVSWQWVKGHTGVEGNERADRLATLGVPDPVADTAASSSAIR